MDKSTCLWYDYTTLKKTGAPCAARGMIPLLLRLPPTQLAVSAIFYGQVGSKASLLLLLRTIPLHRGGALRSRGWKGHLKPQPLLSYHLDYTPVIAIGTPNARKVIQ